MSPTAGSKADLPCPKCRSGQVKVALNTSIEVYYLCSSCAHAWSVPLPRSAKAADDKPRSRKAV